MIAFELVRTIVNMKGRIYDPMIGRFLSPDPIVHDPFDSQSWNRYSYVRNSPLNATDPSGFDEVTFADSNTQAGQENVCTTCMWSPEIVVYAGPTEALGGLTINNGADPWAGVIEVPMCGGGNCHGDQARPDGRAASRAEERGMTSLVPGLAILSAIDAWDDPDASGWERGLLTAAVVVGPLIKLAPLLRVGGEAAAGAARGVGASAIRATYVSTAEELGAVAGRLKAGGMSAEEVVRTISPLRNELKLNIREQGSWLLSKAADLRNFVVYGNRAGPSPEQLLLRYGTWEKALGAISRTNATANRVTGVAP